MAILEHTHKQPSWAALQVMTIDTQQQTLLGLILAVQQADESAFSQLYDLLVERMYSLAYRMMSNVEDSEEVVADAFTQIWQQANQYRVEKSTVVGWCLMITRSRALDRLRRRKTQQNQLVDSEFDIDQQVAIDSNTDELVALFEMGSNTRRLLQSLPQIPRQMVALAFFKGLSHQEIADSCKMPLGTVKSQIKRALALLQKPSKSLTITGCNHEQQ